MPLLTAVAALALGPHQSVSHPRFDHLAASFAFFGCNRMDVKDWEETKQENPSSANLAQLNRTFQDLANLRPIPNLVFGGGDLVMNYADDQGETLRSQMMGWQKAFQSSPLEGKTIMVPFTGNHETNRKVGKQKLPNPATTAVWNRWFAQSGFRQMATNGPTVTNDKPDKLSADQSQMSYSFDFRQLHFVVLNTDTPTTVLDEKTGQPKVGWVPAKWAQQDIEAAQKNPKIKAIFVLGHRNLIDPTVCTGDSPIDKETGGMLVRTIQANPKVRAYVCAHVHAWDLEPMGGASRAWQVIAGNGGSVLEEDWKPKEGTYFGFVVINVYQSGKVVLRNFRRPTPPEPQRYFEDAPIKPPPARPVDTILFDPAKK